MHGSVYMYVVDTVEQSKNGSFSYRVVDDFIFEKFRVFISLDSIHICKRIELHLVHQNNETKRGRSGCFQNHCDN